MRKISDVPRRQCDGDHCWSGGFPSAWHCLARGQSSDRTEALTHALSIARGVAYWSSPGIFPAQGAPGILLAHRRPRPWTSQPGGDRSLAERRCPLPVDPCRLLRANSKGHVWTVWPTRQKNRAKAARPVTAGHSRSVGTSLPPPALGCVDGYRGLAAPPRSLSI